MSENFSKQMAEPVFLTPKDLAPRIGGSTQSLANDRHMGRGLPYIKRGKSVLYFWPEVVEILRSNRIEPRRA